MVENLIEKYKLFQTNLDNCIEIIELNYNVKKISSALKEFYKLGLNPFKDELQSLGANLDINQVEVLMSWYKEKSKCLCDLENQINSIEAQIDKEVYKLYGLNDDDVKIVEGDI